MFSLESPHRGDSNEYIQYTITIIKQKITLNYPKYNNACSCGIFPRDSRMSSKDEPSVFEPLKFYCMQYSERMKKQSTVIFLLPPPPMKKPSLSNPSLNPPLSNPFSNLLLNPLSKPLSAEERNK